MTQQVTVSMPTHHELGLSNAIDVEADSAGQQGAAAAGDAPSTVTMSLQQITIEEQNKSPAVGTQNKSLIQTKIASEINVNISLDESIDNLDKDWAWLVMLAALLTHILTFGMSYATVGAFYVEFLREFKQSNAATSWTGSILLGVMLCSGPLISILIDKFGACAVAIVGGLFASAGLFISSMATSIIHLYFSFGVLTGLGLGMSYLPCIVMLGRFFERRRAFAAGIAASGSGLGTFIFAPLNQSLLAILGWRNSFLVLGAIELTLCLCGITYLERKVPNRNMVLVERQNGPHISSEFRQFKASSAQSLVIFGQKTRVRPSFQSLNSYGYANNKGAKDRRTPVGSWMQCVGVRIGRSVLQLPAADVSNQATSPYLSDNVLGMSMTPVGSVRSTSTNNIAEASSQAQPRFDEEARTADIVYATSATTSEARGTNNHKAASDQAGSFVVCSWKESVHVRAGLSNFLQSPVLSPVADSPLTLDSNSIGVSISPTRVSLNCSEGGSQHYTLGSILDPVPEEELFVPAKPQSSAISVVTPVAVHDQKTSEEEHQDCPDKDDDDANEQEAAAINRLGPLAIIMSLLHNRFFLLFCISNILLCVGYQLPYMYIKAFALTLDTGDDGWAVIMAIMGITDMLGRLCVGFVFDHVRCVSHRLVGYITSLFLSGVLLLLMSTSASYPVLTMTATIYTLVAGSTDPLVPALLVEYVGLDKLCYSYGMVSEMQGLGFLLGPPLAGLVYNYFQDYATIFVVGALAFVVSGSIMTLEPCLNMRTLTCRNRRRDDSSQIE